MDKEGSVQRFLELIRRSHRGKFKVYIGMSAGVGKTYRMLQEAHQLLDAGVDVCIGYIETHGRAETEALAEGLPFVPRRRLFYKGKELEEMDTQAILNLHPEIVVVDELAHTNIEGSGNPKRWQDVMQLLDAGISVITAVNIQQLATSVGDEGGFAPDLASDEEAIQYILDAVKNAGYEPGRDFRIAMDAASLEWKSEKGKGFYKLPKAGTEFTSAELIEHSKKLVEKYPIISIEDALDEERCWCYRGNESF